ncbi:hypothetical protein DUI87_07784 [Hirundo rustica rustica]|uniref:Rna-directed dna polymerase from mobile element jockey-like n=1 Tax=Hirundo rustica rustica TaxID=333673 RepID=A0A3M0KR41_HIRRU|nr:hypothetical protein DUI87_07784 [Hirundo rustica rustica]
MTSRGTKLVKWAHENLMKLNTSKCKVLHLGRGNPTHEHRLGEELIESSPGEKDLGILVDGKGTGPSDGCTLGLLQKQRGQRVEGDDSALYFPLVRPHLDCYLQLWGPQHMNGMDFLWIMERDKTVTGMEHLSSADRLEELELFSLEERLWEDLIMTFQYLKETYQKGGRGIFLLYRQTGQGTMVLN